MEVGLITSLISKYWSMEKGYPISSIEFLVSQVLHCSVMDNFPIVKNRLGPCLRSCIYSQALKVTGLNVSKLSIRHAIPSFPSTSGSLAVMCSEACEPTDISMRLDRLLAVTNWSGFQQEYRAFHRHQYTGKKADIQGCTLLYLL